MPTFHSWSGCHDLCIVDNVVELMERGYTCYLEYELSLGGKKKAVVDIYAVKQDKQILVEVGYLSLIHGDRVKLLKSLMPNAKVIHVHQWKNYLSVYDCDEEYIRWRTMNYAWKEDKELYVLLSENEIDVRMALSVAASGLKWSEGNEKMGNGLIKNQQKVDP